jgi:NAD(P)H-flavin reductase
MAALSPGVHCSFVPRVVPVAEIARATPRSLLLSLDLQGAKLDFLAGQAVMAGADGQPARRPYSIACSPERCAETGQLELLVGLDPDGSPGAHLPALERGTRIEIEGPLGSFTFPATVSHRRLLFVAGGTGIAPLRAMLDHVFRTHPAEQVSLLYSARRADEFAFMPELRAHETAGRLELHATVTREDLEWAGGRGRIGRSHFEAVLHDRLDTLCFICGPGALVSEAVTTLADLGVPQASIRTEEWTAR